MDRSKDVDDARAASIEMSSLYTPAMLAEVLGAPVSSIRRWHRQGILVASQCVRRLPYFDFAEVSVAQKLVQLADAGCSLRMIDRRLDRLAKLLPESPRPLADPRVVVDGRRLYLRRGDDLAEPGGQLLLEFEADSDEPAQTGPAVLAFDSAHPAANATRGVLDDLRQEALDFEEAGDLPRAADAYRGLLAASGPSAEINFALADVLYRQGDLTAARERFYAAIELDEEYVEARFSLGCVLVETGDLELAAAAFQGTLAFHADYADAHFHLARVLERLHRKTGAVEHYAAFLSLAPDSPWASAARDRLSQLPAATATSAVVQGTVEGNG